MNVVTRDVLHMIGFFVLIAMTWNVRAEVRGLNEAILANRDWRDKTTHALARMEGRVEAIERLMVSLAAGKDGGD